MAWGYHFILTVCWLITTASAFWDTGHMIIARIAYDQIKKISPFTLYTVEQKITVLQNFSNEGKYPFVESSIWADENKHIGWNAFRSWHSEGIPYLHSGFGHTVHQNTANITWAIDEMIRTISYSKPCSMPPSLGLSFAWRYLIHLVGDLHQPLHAVNMYSVDFPEGDRFGHHYHVNCSLSPE
mmetsp:Transcript_26124/g.30172  ORF Transcript_26124/g.30172 Transcript_26124/m.30172 type:complete len:183 (-) Transcript_26124:375-923(-)